jgi:hypothetical protein
VFKDFIQSESGAITVDWVVLTAGITGMAIATVAVVSGGVENLAGDTSSQLSGFSIQTAFAVSQSLLSTDFSEGIGAWVGGTVASLTGFGDVLQLGPGELTQDTFAVPEGATTATLSFDMLGIDDLSGEAASIFINGQEVAFYSDDHGNITTQEMGVPGVTVVGQPTIFERPHRCGQPRQ